MSDFLLPRFYDSLGRSTGYAINGTRQTTIAYDTYGRISTMTIPTTENGENVRSPTPTLNSNSYIWDPTEPIATRPLVWLRADFSGFYAHDGNKNVSEALGMDDTTVAHYEYAPFGAVTTQRGESAAANPWRFSSEFVDDELGCDYYNYREYEPVTGRWMCRDLVEGKDALLFVGNSPVDKHDRVGLYGNPVSGCGQCYSNSPNNWGFDGSSCEECPDGAKVRSLGDGSLAFYRTKFDDHSEKECNGCGAKGGLKFPDSYMGIVDFIGCCNDHDVCYGTCSRDKSVCDKNLGDCMRRKCEQALKYVYHEKALCNMMADAYEMAVSSFGDDAYETGQDSGCVWMPCCKKR